MKIETSIGKLLVNEEFPGSELSWSNRNMNTGIEEVSLVIKSEKEFPPSPFSIEFSPEQIFGMQTKWTASSGFKKDFPATWSQPMNSSLARSMPLVSYFDHNGINGVTLAVSEAKRLVKITSGINEINNLLNFRIDFFTEPEAPLSEYNVVLRFDTRKVFYADAIRSASDWFASMSEYTPAKVPETAYEPLYSTWYSYHQALTQKDIEKECQLAAEYGMKTVIVDDGWQSDRDDIGYRTCGDWKLSHKKFPNMAEHVTRVHEAGLKYMVWFSVPFLGFEAEKYEEFKTKCLFSLDHMKTAVFDPRFPEVREYLISTYEKAVREWNLDGLKLDFIEQFHLRNGDPAEEDNYAGRDIKSLPEAVDKLLSETLERLKAIKSDILIEFRRDYIGPAVRKYGNMFRAGDCPGDIVSNRIQTIDLRFTSGNTAVHSDMITWHMDESTENAALQLLNVLFSVPQISVRLAELPPKHQIMLRFWLNFIVEHRNTLLKGKLIPTRPELNYPVVYAETDDETVIAVYDPGQYIPLKKKRGHTYFTINATGSELQIFPEAGYISQQSLDVCGNPFSMNGKHIAPTSGMCKVKY